MELQLQQQTLPYYEVTTQAVCSFETTQEAIVPDYCADVERIVDVTGCALLHSRELLADGRLELCGVIKTSVLLLGEGVHEVCALQLSLPMHGFCDGKRLSDCGQYTAAASLKSIDARLLNPRKLLIRAETVVELRGYEEKNLVLAVGIEETEDLETLYDGGETSVATALLEREFSYVDEMTLSAARPAIREILTSRTQLGSAECRVVGNKLVVKGIARAEILYKDEGGEIAPLQQEFLFSQILPCEGAGEGSHIRCEFDLTGYEYEIGSEANREDRRTVTMQLHIHSRIQVVETRKITFLSDLYSTIRELKPERQGIFLMEGLQSYTKKQSLRELIPTASAVKDVIWATAQCGACRSESGEQGSFVEANVSLHCLYLDENNALYAAEKEITIKAETELSSSDHPTITIRSPGELSATPSPEGVDLRFALEFSIETLRRINKSTVCRVDAAEGRLDRSGMPSLVLRKFERGMKLWDIAKTYHTTAAAILAANELESEGAVAGDQLLLIPRHK